MAEKYVAIPGTSEHQLGLSVDINADQTKCSSEKVYSWLANNAYKYGFIKRYPSSKSYITGINNEPWHYRYVGKEAAATIKNQNLCLEEYLKNMAMLANFVINNINLGYNIDINCISYIL